jgi:hypothetical protein
VPRKRTGIESQARGIGFDDQGDALRHQPARQQAGCPCPPWALTASAPLFAGIQTPISSHTVALPQLRIRLKDGRQQHRCQLSPAPAWLFLKSPGGGRVMIDPDSRLGRGLKVAEEFFALAKTVPTPFMRSYYQRVAERYLSSKGELRAETPSGLSTRASPS